MAVIIAGRCSGAAYVATETAFDEVTISIDREVASDGIRDNSPCCA
jgi:hypothetical protein